jgi:phage terminase small subunit
MTQRLTPKQERFVEEYQIDLNATQACIRAGYSARNADKIGPQLLGKTRVASAIAERQEILRKKLKITQENTLEELARIAFFDCGDLFDGQGRLLPLDRIPEDARRALASIETEHRTIGKGDDAKSATITIIRAFDKLKTLEQLGKHLGLFVERKEISGPGGGSVETKITDYPPELTSVAEWVKQRDEAEAGRTSTNCGRRY